MDAIQIWYKCITSGMSAIIKIYHQIRDWFRKTAIFHGSNQTCTGSDIIIEFQMGLSVCSCVHRLYTWCRKRCLRLKISLYFSFYFTQFWTTCVEVNEAKNAKLGPQKTMNMVLPLEKDWKKRKMFAVRNLQGTDIKDQNCLLLADIMPVVSENQKETWPSHVIFLSK